MPLEQELATLERERERLEREHHGKFVLVKGAQVIDTFDSFDSAAEEALTRFGQGPYLIRQIGEEITSLPPAVAYGLIYPGGWSSHGSKPNRGATTTPSGDIGPHRYGCYP